MKLIRKISIGQDYKNEAMHYSVGQEVYGGHTISDILEEDGTYKIYITKNKEILPWKHFNSNMAISVEYNLDYQMQSIFNYIISTNNRYNNKTVVGNKELILNTEITERDYMFVNRIGVVENLPIAFKTNIREKDKVIVHHNVFRRWIDQSGSERDSANFLKENKYSVSEDQIFAYNRNGIWECLPEYCFVQPIYKKGTWSLKTDENLKGVLVYSNKELSSLGASVGDVVGFTPDSEYEFIIEGKKLYRILSNHITLNYGPEEKSN